MLVRLPAYYLLQDALRGEGSGMGLDQTAGGIIHCLVREGDDRGNLEVGGGIRVVKHNMLQLITTCNENQTSFQINLGLFLTTLE